MMFSRWSTVLGGKLCPLLHGIQIFNYPQPCYEDSMDLIAKLPAVASMIYRTTFYDGEVYYIIVLYLYIYGTYIIVYDGEVPSAL